MRGAFVLVLVSMIGCGSDSGDSPQAEGPQTAQKNSDVKTSSKKADPKRSKQDEAAAKLLATAKLHLKNRQHLRAVELLSALIAAEASEEMHERAYLLRAISYSNLRQDVNALADFSAALRTKSKAHESRTRNARGHFFMLRGRSREALGDFTKSIELDEKFAEPRNNRGLIYLSQGKLDKAFDDFDAAVKNRTGYADALNNRGFINLRREKYKEAIPDFDRALKIKANFVAALSNRGLCQFRLTNYEKSVADYNRAAMLEPLNPRHLLSRRQALLKLGRTDEAEEDQRNVAWLNQLKHLTQQIKRDPKSPAAFVARANHWAVAKKQKQALADIKRALTLSENYGPAFLARAELMFAADEYVKAIEDCDRALVRNSGSTEAYSIRGDCRLRLREYAKAVEDYVRARRLDEPVALAYWHLSEELRESGKTAEADEAKAQALALDPNLASKPPIRQAGFTKPAPEKE